MRYFSDTGVPRIPSVGRLLLLFDTNSPAMVTHSLHSVIGWCTQGHVTGLWQLTIGG